PRRLRDPDDDQRPPGEAGRDPGGDPVKDLGDHVAIVTGAARGIGRAIAKRLAESGTAVVIADIDMDAASKTSAELNRAKGRTMPQGVDVASEAAVEAM